MNDPQLSPTRPGRGSRVPLFQLNSPTRDGLAATQASPASNSKVTSPRPSHIQASTPNAAAAASRDEENGSPPSQFYDDPPSWVLRGEEPQYTIVLPNGGAAAPAPAAAAAHVEKFPTDFRSAWDVYQERQAANVLFHDPILQPPAVAAVGIRKASDEDSPVDRKRRTSEHDDSGLGSGSDEHSLNMDVDKEAGSADVVAAVPAVYDGHDVPAELKPLWGAVGRYDRYSAKLRAVAMFKGAHDRWPNLGDVDQDQTPIFVSENDKRDFWHANAKLGQLADRLKTPELKRAFEAWEFARKYGGDFNLENYLHPAAAPTAVKRKKGLPDKAEKCQPTLNRFFAPQPPAAAAAVAAPAPAPAAAAQRRVAKTGPMDRFLTKPES